jgi:hypothetical protein
VCMPDLVFSLRQSDVDLLGKEVARALIVRRLGTVVQGGFFMHGWNTCGCECEA